MYFTGTAVLGSITSIKTEVVGVNLHINFSGACFQVHARVLAASLAILCTSLQPGQQLRSDLILGSLT